MRPTATFIKRAVKCFGTWCAAAIVFGGLCALPVLAQPNWTQALPATSPSLRVYSAMAYDPVHQQTVLFGGCSTPPNGYSCSTAAGSETWIWDGSNWTNAAPAVSPSSRRSHVMAWDAIRQKIVLVGGVDTASGFPISDTWTWDGSVWSQLTTTGSPVFSNPSYLAFFPRLSPSPDQLVLLIHGNYLNGQWIPPQTWYLDSVSNVWTKQSVAHTTFNLDGGGLAYDPLRENLVLDSTDMLVAGGARVENTYLNSDISSDWVVQNPSHHPPPTWNPSSVWAGNINGVLRFGGFVLGGGSGDYSDTWEWDGDDWIQLAPATVPPARRGAAMAYDDAHRQVVMFGGFNDNVSPVIQLADTWLFANQQTDQWTQAQPAVRPNASYDFAMASDPRNLQTVIFGGSSNNVFGFAETWTWDGTNWQKKAPANSPPGGYWGAMADDGQELILFGGFSSSAQGLSNDTWSWDGNNWTLKTPATRPPARRSAALAYDALHHQTVLFGGRDPNGNYMSDTWLWDGTTWTQRFPASSPPGTVAVGMAYDAKHQNVVLFNGANNLANPSNTWLWDGNNWTQQSPSVYPPSRGGVDSISLAYDSANQRTVLFGGGGINSAVLGDTWAWDGANWSQLAPVGQPSNREQVKLAYDAARQQTVLYGGLGCGSANYCSDTWLLGSTAPTTTSVSVAVPSGVQFIFNGVTYTGSQTIHIAPGTYSLGTASPQTISGSQAVFVSWSDGGAQSHAVTVGSTALAISGNFNFLYVVVILAPQGVQYTLGSLTLSGTTNTYLSPGSYSLSVSSPQTIAPGTIAQFVSWSDAGAQSHSITVANSALNVIGTFTLQYLVTTISSPAAEGTVVGGGYYTRGSGVTLTAMANAGYEFDNWSGPCTGSGSCYFGINGPLTVTANFSSPVQWYPLFPATQPTPRTNATMAYDSQRKVTVLFGGQDANGNLFNDTWEWDGANWNKRTPSTVPVPRKWEALAYDAVNHQTIMFGGLAANDVRLGDTWIWDGTNWIQKIVTGPSVRSSTRMAFDAAHNQIVLFGGATSDTTQVADTWTWNGSLWTQKFPATGPSARGAHMLVYDEARQQTVLFGGGLNNAPTAFSDTWIWDGTNWTQASPSAAPEARSHFAAAFDQTLQQIVIFGGVTGNFANVVWLWDGVNWTKKTYSISPTDRGEIAAAYDAARNQYVVMGGYSASDPIFLNGYTNDTWVFANNLHPAQFVLTSTASPANGGTVTEYAVGQPGPLYYAGSPVAATAVPNAGFELQSWSGACSALQRCVVTLNANQSVTANFGTARNWVQLFPSVSPAASADAAYGIMAYDKARQQTVMFDSQGRTWTFDGTQWTLRNPANKPPAGNRQLVYDEANNQTVLFGGFTATDTWTWDGIDWTQRFPANHPPARITFVFAYNPLNGTVLLFGGNAANDFSDTWIWDGRALTWTQAFPIHTPTARSAPGFAFDPVNRGILMFGGDIFSGGPVRDVGTADTYLWNGSDWLLQSPAAVPSSRLCAAMVLDESREEIILFGGAPVVGDASNLYSDTWVWDGTNWTRRNPVTLPSARACAAAAYDAFRKLPMLFGGEGVGDAILSDTWVYGAAPPPSQYTLTTNVIGSGTLTTTAGGPTYASGTTVQITATASPGYEFEYWTGGACTGSSPVCSLVMNGNKTVVANFAAPIQWIQLNPSTSPSPAGPSTENLTMAYDETRQQIVFFGGPYGSRYGNQTWLWNGTTWTEAFPATIPPARDACGLAYDPVHQQIVMFGGYNGAALADTWIWDGSNWTQKAAGVPGPSGRINHGMAFDGQRIVLYGGYDGINSNFNDTWTWDGNTWTQAFPANSPGARSDFGMTFDAARQQIVLFSDFAGTPDTWIWDGTTWTNRLTANAPPGGWNAMAYDSVRQQIFILTESFGLNAPSQTWAWDGTNWTKKNTTINPGIRYASAMAFDAARQQTILFGGFAGSVAADTWTLAGPSTNLIPQTPIVTRSGANYVVTVTLKNQGNVPITSLSLTSGKLGSATGAPTTPATLTGIAPGAVASFTVQVPIASVPGTTAALSFTGTYSTQLTTNAPWSASVRSVTLP